MSDEKTEPDPIIEAALRGVTHQFLVRFLREKLTEAGATATDANIRNVATQIITGHDGSISFGSKGPRNVQIAITQDDVDAILTKVAHFAENDLSEILVRQSEISAKRLYKDLQRKWSAEHRQQIKGIRGFRNRLEKRYGVGLDKLRMLVTIATEWGQETFQRKQAAGRGTLSNLDDVMMRLHIRGCQVTLEIITLLETGLADGAMARWRTLHEISTTAFFIEKHGEVVAKRYVDYQIVESRRALRTYEECREDLGYRKHSKAQAKKAERAYDLLIAKYGKEFGGEYGWAAHLIGQGKDKRVTFARLQKAADLEMMRAHYQMASYNVHAGPKGVYFKLGQLKPSSNVLLAGSSNAGLVEPAQNAALSLGKLTVAACNDPDAPPFDNLVFIRVVNRLTKEIPQDFAKAERQLKRDHFSWKRRRSANTGKKRAQTRRS